MVGIEKEDASVYWLGRRNYSSTVVLHGARLLTHAAIELAVSLGTVRAATQFSGRFEAGAPRLHCSSVEGSRREPRRHTSMGMRKQAKPTPLLGCRKKSQRP